ncbi:cytochrome P450 [Kutzneria sp. NPDC052558]|uniref:cytochrome P450 n=1 Tax=Kutzneria sp. NPDC052558 TaxID=3364121 RepID=UPI0037CA0266
MSENEVCPLRFPPPRESVFGPLSAADELRRRPVTRVELPTGQPAWLISSHEQAKAVLADPRVSCDPTRPGAPRMIADANAPRHMPGFFIDHDPPEHTRLRRLVIPELSVRRVEAMRPVIQRIVDDAVDGLLRTGPPANLVHDFAFPVPCAVMGELLGVPPADFPYFRERTAALVDTHSGSERRRIAFAEIHAYFDRLAGDFRKHPADNLLSRLAAAERAVGIGHDEVVGMAVLLLIAGFETTASMIALGAAALLGFPEQRAAVCAAAGSFPEASEEMLRFFSNANLELGGRTALADLDIAGETIRAGDAIVVNAWLANHDPAAYERPEAFDVRRGDRRHLAFGHGAHQCVGQNLARVEMEIALRALFTRLPRVRLGVPVAELRANTSAAMFGLDSLPVAW